MSSTVAWPKPFFAKTLRAASRMPAVRNSVTTSFFVLMMVVVISLHGMTAQSVYYANGTKRNIGGLMCGEGLGIFLNRLRLHRVPVFCQIHEILTAGDRNRRQSLPSPDTHRVFGFELVTEVTRESADLTSVMRIVLDKIRKHVDCAARHTLNPGSARCKGGLEQAR